MAKYIDTQFIAAGATQPVKKGTLDLMQEAQQEGVSNIALALIQQGDLSIGSSPSNYFEWNDFYVLYGCNSSATYGVIWHQGQFYEAPAASLVPIFGQVVVGTITPSPTIATDADPVIFGGTGGTHNVHINSRIIWSMGVSGSGDIDFDDLKYLGQWRDMTYFASNLFAANGTFTIASSANYVLRIHQTGRTVNIYFEISNATTSLSTPNVSVRIPINAPFNGTFKTAMQNTCSLFDGTSRMGIIYTSPGTRDLLIYRADGINIPATSGTFKIFGQITAEIEI